MRKLLFISTWDFSNEIANGICKKIKNQIDAFRSCGFYVDYTFLYYQKQEVILVQNEEKKIIGHFGALGKVAAHKIIANNIDFSEYDCAYIRYSLSDKNFIKLLKQLKNNNVKTVIEIPTFPYEQEIHSGLKEKVNYQQDRIFRKQLKGLVDRIVTYSLDEKIFDIPTINVTNGVNVKIINKQSYKKHNGKINIIAVAGFAPWHGYDRLIYGLKNYYSNGGKRNVVFHLVGDGAVLSEYKRLVSQFQLSEHILFYGYMSGTELDLLFNEMDIAVGCLGMYRKGIENFVETTLKTREYCARGIPAVVCGHIDAFENEWPYELIISNDSSDVDIMLVLEFYDRIMNERETGKDIADIIRTQSAQRVEMKNVIKEIVNYYG